MVSEKLEVVCTDDAINLSQTGETDIYIVPLQSDKVIDQLYKTLYDITNNVQQSKEIRKKIMNVYHEKPEDEEINLSISY